MAWHEEDQNITPPIHRKWNTKINTMFLYTIQNQWYFIDLDVKGQGKINIMFVDVLYSYHVSSFVYKVHIIALKDPYFHPV